VCFSHDPMPKRSATPRIALMNNNREAERALRGGYSGPPTVYRFCGNGSGREQASSRSPLEPSVPVGSELIFRYHQAFARVRPRAAALHYLLVTPVRASHAGACRTLLSRQALLHCWALLTRRALLNCLLPMAS
jgi:hypothetical protein